MVRDVVGRGTTSRLAQFAALSLSMVLYKPPSLVVNVFAYAETMEYSRGRRTFERTRRVDLDVNYRSPGPDVSRGEGVRRVKGESEGKDSRTSGKRGWKKETWKKRRHRQSIASAKPDWTALSSSPSS